MKKKEAMMLNRGDLGVNIWEGFFWFVFKIYLKDRVTDRKRKKRERDVSFTHWSPPWTASTARAWPVWRWELPPGLLHGYRGPCTRAILPCFSMPSAGRWIRSGTARPCTSTQMGFQALRWQLYLLCHSASWARDLLNDSRVSQTEAWDQKRPGGGMASATP